jgi:hypothetical protein
MPGALHVFDLIAGSRSKIAIKSPPIDVIHPAMKSRHSPAEHPTTFYPIPVQATESSNNLKEIRQ